MPRKAKMWDHFIVVDVAASKAACNYCHKCLSFKTTVSNLKNHLKHKHSGIFKGICRENVTRKADPVADVGSGTADGIDIINVGGIIGCETGAESRTDSGSIIPQPHPMPSTENPPKEKLLMASYLSRPSFVHDKTDLDRLLVNMVAIDCQPFSIVNDEGFKSFVYGLNPDYILPDRQTLSNTLLLREYTERLATIKSVVKTECISMCITVDCWTSKTKEAYIAISGHFIKKISLEFKSVLLECRHLGGSHTVENIAQAISLAVIDWDLVGKINFMVSNNAPNMQSAANMLQYNHFGCYAHKFNVVAKMALKEKEIDATINKIKKTVTHFKRNSEAKEKLIRYQVNVQGVAEENALTFFISVPTRWSSTFLMLQRFVQLQEAIKAVVPSLYVSLPIISQEEWKCLEQYCAVLKPLYEATLIMNAENYLTGSKAVVITKGLQNIYEQMSTNIDYYMPLQLLIRNINLGLKKEFSDLNINMNITVSTFLDPRFKQHAFEEETLLSTKKYILEEIRLTIGAEEAPIPPPKTTAITEFSLWNAIDKNILTSQQPHNRIQEEVDMYLKQAVIGREDCPFQWWRVHKTIYPSLFTMVLKYCNIVVTSVPCERAFSKAGHIINDRRSRLTSSKVAQLMFLHGNKNF